MGINSNVGRSAALCAALTLTLAGCGTDDTPDPADTDAAPSVGAGEPTDDDAAASGGESAQGNATLFVDGVMYSTDSTICDIAASDTGGIEFNYIGSGTTDGKPFNITASFSSEDDGSGGITIVDSMAVMVTSPSQVLWSTPSEGTDRVPSEFTVNGDLVSYKGDVIDPMSDATGRATFVTTCS